MYTQARKIHIFNDFIVFLVQQKVKISWRQQCVSFMGPLFIFFHVHASELKPGVQNESMEEVTVSNHY